MEVRVRQVDWALTRPFRIAYKTRTQSRTVVVELQREELVGRGEALGVSYRGETPELLVEQIKGVAQDLNNGISRAELQVLLPPGGARNAIDCALWDLEAKRSGQRAWQLAGLDSVRPLTTAYTLGIDTPEEMARLAADSRKYSLLKIKLAGEGDIERVRAIRAARPDAELVVDANQSWSERLLEHIPPRLVALGVKLIEQPLPVGTDACLTGFKSPIPLCADESCQTRASLDELVGRYQMINIKLDKTGGLTEALDLAREARQRGLGLMVGCMAGTSLSMAPAFIVGQSCSVVDLDGPLLTTNDVPNRIRYEGGRMFPPDGALWG